ncbi:MAG: crossover junction endodeoxyribonuclease RuvC [Chloroflexota bacterium]
MRILGLDPGTLALGYGLIEDDPPRFVASGALTVSARTPIGARLLKLYQGVMEVIGRFRPQEVAVEEPFVSKNPRSALALGRAQGIAVLAAAAWGLPLYYYSPAQVKQQAAGYGNSPKAQVQEMVRLQLGLETAPQPADAADALAVALCHYYQTRQELR